MGAVAPNLLYLGEHNLNGSFKDNIIQESLNYLTKKKYKIFKRKSKRGGHFQEVTEFVSICYRVHLF